MLRSPPLSPFAGHSPVEISSEGRLRMEPHFDARSPCDETQRRMGVAETVTEAQTQPTRQGDGLTRETEEVRRTCEV